MVPTKPADSSSEPLAARAFVPSCLHFYRLPVHMLTANRPCRLQQIFCATKFRRAPRKRHPKSDFGLLRDARFVRVAVTRGKLTASVRSSEEITDGSGTGLAEQTIPGTALDRSGADCWAKMKIPLTWEMVNTFFHRSDSIWFPKMESFQDAYFRSLIHRFIGLVGRRGRDGQRKGQLSNQVVNAEKPKTPRAVLAEGLFAPSDLRGCGCEKELEHFPYSIFPDGVEQETALDVAIPQTGVPTSFACGVE